MNYKEEQLRELTLEALQQLGDNATPEAIVNFIEAKLGGETKSPEAFESKSGERVILTAFGMNHPGVIASVSSLLSEKNCDILDVSQKIMQEFFTLIMLLDLNNASVTLKELQTEMNLLSEKLKIKIYLQHEDVFRSMHRI